MSDSLKELANFLLRIIISLFALLATLSFEDTLNSPFEFMILWLLTIITIILLNGVKFE